MLQGPGLGRAGPGMGALLGLLFRSLLQDFKE